MQTLSSFVSDQLQKRHDGPIPSQDMRFLEQLTAAERQAEQMLSPVERALKVLADDYADLLRETAFLEARRQIYTEMPDAAAKRRFEHCLARAITFGRALRSSSEALMTVLNGNPRPDA